MSNYKQCEYELLGMIEKKSEKNNQILEFMESIDRKTERWNLKELEESEIKEQAIEMYNRITNAWVALTNNK